MCGIADIGYVACHSAALSGRVAAYSDAQRALSESELRQRMREQAHAMQNSITARARKQHRQQCEGCGAPTRGDECEYCGR